MLNVDKKFNLIITCPRNREKYAIKEFESIMYLIGCTEFEIWKSGISGLLLSNVQSNPHNIVKNFRELLRERPWEFKNIKRVIPIDILVDSNYEDISIGVEKIWPSIPVDSTFKILVKKRFTDLSSRKIIEYTAKNIDRKVDLKNPDYIIDIEIVGSKTGIALVEKDEILSVEKELLS